MCQQYRYLPKERLKKKPCSLYFQPFSSNILIVKWKPVVGHKLCLRWGGEASYRQVVASHATVINT